MSDLRESPPRNTTRKSDSSQDDAQTEKSSVVFGSEEDTSNEVHVCRLLKDHTPFSLVIE